MKTMRKPAAWMALLLSFLMTVPPAALAEDTELFATSGKPTVLLILDASGSMSSGSDDTTIGDLTGEGTSNTRMDALVKVVYTLLNADMSEAGGSAAGNIYGTLVGGRYYNEKDGKTYYDSSNTVLYRYSTTYKYVYSRVAVSYDFWNALPASGTIKIGTGTEQITVSYTYKDHSSNGYYYVAVSSLKFTKEYDVGATVAAYTLGSAAGPYPKNATEAFSADFLNNLTQTDEDLLKIRLGLMDYVGTSDSYIFLRNSVSSGASMSTPFVPSYRTIWDNVMNKVVYEWVNTTRSGTPTAKTLVKAKTFFKTATADNTVNQSCPYFAILVTDGEDTVGSTTSVNGPDYFYGTGDSLFDSNGCGGGPCDPGDEGQIARHNWVIQRAAELAAGDSTTPPVKLYVIGVGISGTNKYESVTREALRRASEQANDTLTKAEADAFAHTNGPDGERVADRAFFATSAEELSLIFRRIVAEISGGTYAFTAPTVASLRSTDRDYLYKATFEPKNPPATLWHGELIAMTIDNNASIWNAGTLLQAKVASERKIFTSYRHTDNTWKRLEFTTGNLTADHFGIDNETVADNIVGYVRGENHNNDRDNNVKLGDIFHSKPVVVGPPSQFYFDTGYSGAGAFATTNSTRRRVIYVGANDGMLHAFLSGDYVNGAYDKGTGAELFGYVPNAVWQNLGDFLPGDLSNHGYFVDSSPRVADVWIDGYGSGTADGVKTSSEWRSVLIGGLRMGGSAYYALDITSSGQGGSTDYGTDSSPVYPIPLWEYSPDTDNTAMLGQTWSEPVIGKIRVTMDVTHATVPDRDRWVAIFGGGKSWDPVNGGSTRANSLTVMDIATGRPLKTFTTGIDNNIVASPTYLLDPSGYIRYIYVSDYKGGVYKFDFRNRGVESTGYPQWVFKKIFQSVDDQPVYNRVESGTISESVRYLYFGTGNQEFPVSDNLRAGRFYAIKDTDGWMPSSPLTDTSLQNLTTNLGTANNVPNDNGWYIILDNIVNSSVNTIDNNTHVGEKVLSDPVVYYNNVYFTTFTPTTNTCADACKTGDGIARLYGINMLTAKAALDIVAGETSPRDDGNISYRVYEGGVPSTVKLSIKNGEETFIVFGLSNGEIRKERGDSPSTMKTIKSWKETF